jgi:uncharacterized protein YndB with AHSA1/START domain
MNQDLKATRSIEIFAHIDKVWNALTQPGQMKTYFFASDVDADWSEGGDINLEVNREGGTLSQKGEVLEIKPKELIKYKFWQDPKNQPEENFSIITYQLEDVSAASVKLTWMEEGFADEAQKDRKESELPRILNQIKLIVEKEEHGSDTSQV